MGVSGRKEVGDPVKSPSISASMAPAAAISACSCCCTADAAAGSECDVLRSMLMFGWRAELTPCCAAAMPAWALC